MSNLAFAYNNLATASATTLSASSALTLAPVSRLQGSHVARKWRGKNGNSESIIFDLGSSLAWDTLALIGTNLTSTGLTRVRGSNIDPTGASGEIYDSTSIAGRVDENYGDLIILRNDSTASRYGRIDLSDTGLTYIDAGCLLISVRTQVTINFLPGWSRAWIDPSRKTIGQSGQTFIDQLDSYRVLDLTLGFLSQSERDGFVESIDRDLGEHTNFLTITDPASTNLGRDCLWGYIDGNTPVIEPVVLSPAAYSKTYKIHQRL